MSVTARARVPRTSVLTAVPAQQRRQQALEACLATCLDLDVLDESDKSRSELDGAATQACQLVDTSQRLAALEANLRIARDKQAYGPLLRPAELEHKVERLDAAQTALSFVLQNQERLSSFLQQPHSGPSLTLEKGYQAHLLSILGCAMRDTELLSKGSLDLDWVMQFKEPSTTWTKLLQPTPQVTTIISQFHDGLADMHKAIDSFQEASMGAI